MCLFYFRVGIYAIFIETKVLFLLYQQKWIENLQNLLLSKLLQSTFSWRFSGSLVSSSTSSSSSLSSSSFGYNAVVSASKFYAFPLREYILIIWQNRFPIYFLTIPLLIDHSCNLFNCIVLIINFILI